MVAFNKTKIKNYLECSKTLDLVEGFQDIGHLGKENKLVSQVMVFMVRGLYSNWKLPVAYFLCLSAMNHIILSNLILKTVEKLLKVGSYVKSVVCDQGTNNQAAYRKLGMSSL